jgi:tetratricopeptide (TPR) repeat protein
MLNYILYFLITISLIGLGFIAFHKISILTNLSDEEMIILSRKKGLSQKVREINYKQHWLGLIVGSEKLLWRVKIIFLKTENFLGRIINWLRRHSKIMSQKSKEWVKQKDMKSNQEEKVLSGQDDKKVFIKVNQEKTESRIEEIEDDDDLSISELEKPIKEEQKWINLIVENPKNITAYKFLGLLYWKRHNYADAKNSLEMAVKLGSKDRKVKEILKEMEEMQIE